MRIQKEWKKQDSQNSYSLDRKLEMQNKKPKNAAICKVMEGMNLKETDLNDQSYEI